MFEIGKLVMTSGISHEIEKSAVFAREVVDSVTRYIKMDFSDMEHPEDILMNKSAIRKGNDRIFATYNTSKGKIYIITEWDRSVTTILFPSEY